MGVMTKLRSSTKYILWILVFSFGLLWMLADTKVFDAMQAGPRTLGEVNGESITIDEYNQRVSSYIERYNQQNDGGVSPEMRANFENRAWDELVATKIMQQKMDQMGIRVTDAELVDMVTGDDPVDFIKQQFQREDGTINRQALRQAIESPENSEIWITIEEQLRQQRRQTKLNDYLRSGLIVSDSEVKLAYKYQNSYVNVSYLRFPFSDIEESEVDLSESALREYYNNHQERFEQNETYRFSYVSFDKTPTSKDTSRTLEEMKDLRSRFADASSDSLFMVRQQSDSPYSDSYVAKSDIKEAFSPVLDLEEEEVTEPIMIDGTIHLLKKVDERGNEIKFRNLSRDIIADPIATIDARAEEADDFSFFAEEQGFNSEAKRRNLQVSSALATKGSNAISGLGRSQQIMNFLTRSSEGDVSEPIELNDQFVVVKVNQVNPAGVRPFEEVSQQIRPLVLNRQRKSIMKDRVSKLLDEHADLESLAEAEGKELLSAQDLTFQDNQLPSAGREPMVIGAFFGLSEGEVSGPIEGNGGVYVGRVDEKNESEMNSEIDDRTMAQIRQRLQRRKQQMIMSVWVEQLKEEAEIVDNRAKLL